MTISGRIMAIIALCRRHKARAPPRVAELSWLEVPHRGLPQHLPIRLRGGTPQPAVMLDLGGEPVELSAALPVSTPSSRAGQTSLPRQAVRVLVCASQLIRPGWLGCAEPAGRATTGTLTTTAPSRPAIQQEGAAVGVIPKQRRRHQAAAVGGPEDQHRVFGDQRIGVRLESSRSIAALSWRGVPAPAASR